MLLQKMFVALVFMLILNPSSNSFRGNTADNRSALIADQNAVKEWKDTLYYYKSKLRTCRYARIPVTLGNNTSNTLRYVSMSCSTFDIFTTNTNDARIFQNNNNCFKNGPREFEIPPYGSVRFDVPVYFFAGGNNSAGILVSKEFRIGMGFFEYTDKTSLSNNIVQ
ncbi:MAG: hypothetical protein V4577_27290 [Bacteroidota bacterium]